MQNKHANLICEICSYICSSNNYLNQHKDSHMDFMITSRLCKTVFNNDNELQKHKTAMHRKFQFMDNLNKIFKQDFSSQQFGEIMAYVTNVLQNFNSRTI